METKRANISLAAIEPSIQQNIPLPTETAARGGEMIEWGNGNKYPDYLLDLYNNVPTLRSIVNGNIDFVTGNDIILAEGISLNPRGDSIREQVRDIVKDYEIYGGFCLQVVRDALGRVSAVYYVDMRYVRCNKECNVFYYSEKFGKRGNQKVSVYPAFMPSLDWAKLSDEERNRHASSFLYVKNVHTQTYPAPLYAASVKDCEIERNITDFHLNSLENGFMSSAIINFNNGVPSDEMKREIEDSINEKFAGHSNGARILLSFNDSKDTAATIEMPKIEDFGERYKALAETARQHIFTSFRANPNLFGIPTEGNGFANEQYAESFRLYNRTQIQPVQELIKEAYEKIYGMPVISITPFSMGDDDASASLATQIGVGGTQAMLAILESVTLTTEQKKGTIMALFGIDEQSVCQILNIPYQPIIAE